MSDNHIEIGKRLKQVRVMLDKTQEDFSEILLGKKNKATISAYELGKLPIADKAKVVLFSTLNVNKDWLLTGEGQMFLSDKTEPNRRFPHPNKFVRLLNLDDFLKVERTDTEIRNYWRLLKEAEKNGGTNGD